MSKLSEESASDSKLIGPSKTSMQYMNLDAVYLKWIILLIDYFVYLLLNSHDVVELMIS